MEIKEKIRRQNEKQNYAKTKHESLQQLRRDVNEAQLKQKQSEIIVQDLQQERDRALIRFVCTCYIVCECNIFILII